jgi:superfamily II DNA or RNA helicase
LRACFGDQYNKFLGGLVVVKQQRIGAPLRAELYERVTKSGTSYIRLPRTLIGHFIRHKLLQVECLIKLPEKIPVVLHKQLFDNQTAIVQHLCDVYYTPEKVATGTATALLNLRAGMGKTFVAAGLIAALQLPTVYIVPNRFLMNQAVKDLQECLSGASVAAYNNKRAIPQVLVIVINSAVEQNANFFAQFGLVIYDEVHMYCSENRRRIFHVCTTGMALGMTATSEDRNDGFDVIAHRELATGGVLRAENIPGFDYEDVHFECAVRVINYKGPPDQTQNLIHESTGNVFTHYMHNQSIEDRYRVQLAVNELIELYDWRGGPDNGLRHHIYVFAEEIDILSKAKEAFETCLVNRGDILADMVVDHSLFTGGMKDSEVVNIAANARVMFSTYSYASVGFSIPRMSAIVLLTSRKSNFKQILGRILRRGSDPNMPRVVVDIVDWNTCLRRQFAERKIAYDYYGFKQLIKKVNYTDIECQN